MKVKELLYQHRNAEDLMGSVTNSVLE